MPEVVDHGVSGLLVEDMPEAIAAMDQLLALPRERVRATFDHRFSGRRMAEGYVALYEKLIENKQRSRAT